MSTLLSTLDVARRLRTNCATVHRLRRRGWLSGHRQWLRWRYTTSDVEQCWLRCVEDARAQRNAMRGEQER